VDGPQDVGGAGRRRHRCRAGHAAVSHALPGVAAPRVSAAILLRGFLLRRRRLQLLDISRRVAALGAPDPRVSKG
jgi:hypothetical protein